MLKNFFIITLIIFILTSFGCEKKEKPKEIVAQINGYYMSIDDFKEDLKSLFIYRPQSIKTTEQKLDVLNDLIEKEILLQEAQRLNLDKDKKFIKTIESYWKQSLLVSLIEKKAAEINGSIHIYDDEIRDYYKDLKLKDPSIKPLLRMKDEIKYTLRRNKGTALMQEWLTSLREKSYVKINEEVLKDIEF